MKTLTLIPNIMLTCVFVFSATAFSQVETMPTRKIITPKSYTVMISNMGTEINSPNDDFAPAIAGNGRVLFISSNRTGDQDIFSSISSRGAWSHAANVGLMLNTTNHDGGTAFTPDGYWIYFVSCDRPDSEGDCDLYIAEYSQGKWKNVRNLGSAVNSGKWDSQPSISFDGLSLYFASERSGGYGGTDIWVTTRTYGGEWTEPVNLGPTINTDQDEISPFIAADDRTLYFSSAGHPGIGGLDVYVSRRNGARWSEPENIGTPINTEYDECFYTVRLGTDSVFFASNRPGGIGELDIYQAVPNPLPPSAVVTVTGTVSDNKTRVPIGAKLTVRDIESKNPLSSFRSDDGDGHYVVVLQPGKRYVITAEAPGYLFYSDRFDIPKTTPNNTVKKDIRMTQDIVRLLVFFDFDKATLQRESFVDLDRAIEWLKDNPTVKVELAGHTDNVGSRDYNKRLSTERANSVKDYLIEHGVSPFRLHAVGYGMEVPIATNETEEGRAQNRRVEFRVVARE